MTAPVRRVMKEEIMEPVIELRGTRYSLVEAFEAYLLCIQVVESGAAAQSHPPP